MTLKTLKCFLMAIGTLMTMTACNKNDGFNNNSGGGGDPIFARGCEGIDYPNWEFSPHKLPYPVGTSYKIGLSNCSGAEHSVGLPDQYAIDIVMDIGTLVTASRKGIIMYVEESGLDYEPLKNVVVLKDEDNYFLQYQNLTHNGALVEVGQIVQRGDPIGYSGASGNAKYPHLHFVGTDWDYTKPYGTYEYTSFPITFSNTIENENSLIQGKAYEALPYD
jgi:hypothetical protein